MENLQIQVGVTETIIVFIKTTTKSSKSLLQVAETQNQELLHVYTVTDGKTWVTVFFCQTCVTRVCCWEPGRRADCSDAV